jgi:hypothetical protein
VQLLLVVVFQLVKEVTLPHPFLSLAVLSLGMPRHAVQDLKNKINYLELDT